MQQARIAMYDIEERSARYVECLARHGAEVTLFKYVDTSREAESIASSFDGLLLPGGVDIEPALYGMPLKSCCGETDDLRDGVELLLASAFIAAKKPVLGICRGCQMLNVAMGGTLVQDIAVELGSGTLKHNDAEHKMGGTHDIEISGDSLLCSLVKAERLFVNSVHHQSAARVAPGLTVSATSADGVIEAVESATDFILGVQWHPELLAAADPQEDSLFAAFTEECERVRSAVDAA